MFSRLLLVLIVLVTFTITGCENLPVDLPLPWQQSTQIGPEETDESPQPGGTPTAQPTEPTETATPSQNPKKLILWLPPELDPYGDTDSGRILVERLNAFAYQNKVEIVVRIKSSTGAGSLTDALTATRSAAPEILPDLIVLSAADLQLAADRNLIYPNEAMKEMLVGVDWFPFVKQMSTFEDQVLAVPLLIDPYSMVYNADSQLVPSNEWNQIHKNFGIFGFAADDPTGKFLLLQYLSAGGKAADAQGHALLEETPLVAALQALKDGLNTRHINSLSVQYQNDGQVWQSFLDRNLDTAFVPVSLVLGNESEKSGEPEAALIEPVFSIGSASAWALGNPDAGRQALALQLLADLMQTEFLGKWTEALHRLPARPSALGSWTEPTLKPALEKIAQVTEILPLESVLNKLGPILRNATLLILRDSGDVVETARQAIESVK